MSTDHVLHQRNTSAPASKNQLPPQAGVQGFKSFAIRKGNARELNRAGNPWGQCRYLFALTEIRLLISTRNQCPPSIALMRLLSDLVSHSREQGCGMLLPSTISSPSSHWEHNIGGKEKEGIALLIY